MSLYRASQADLDGLVRRWRRDFDLFAPLDRDHGVVPDWALLTRDRFPELASGLPANSVKRFFFPQPEVLALFSTTDREGSCCQVPADGGRARILLGVRPCDGRSVELNNMVYREDPYYQAARSKTILVGLSCRTRSTTCFCTWTGGSPLGTDGLDILLTELDHGIVLETMTRRGEELLAGAGLPAAGDDETERLEQLRRQEAGLGGAVENPAAVLGEKPLMALYEAPFWDQVAQPCLNCGICTFLCPTCYCFDIQDEVMHGSGHRIRYWDSCMFPLFTLHASGHNPRGQKVQRVRNRFLHKLKYFPDRFGPLSCVGCGRCIRECPVNIDIRGVLRDLLAVE